MMLRYRIVSYDLQQERERGARVAKNENDFSLLAASFISSLTPHHSLSHSIYLLSTDPTPPTATITTRFRKPKIQRKVVRSVTLHESMIMILIERKRSSMEVEVARANGTIWMMEVSKSKNNRRES
jgi:hypothetical protein